MRTFASLALAGALLAAPLAEAATINPMNEIAPAGLINSPGDWGRGYSFTADSANIYVTELGLATPSAAIYEIALWDLTNSVQLALLNGIQSVANAWTFGAIGPVGLTQGNHYAVTLYGDAGEQYYYTNNTAYLPSTADISYVDLRYCNSCNEGVLPISILNGFNYGYVDIGYQIGAPSAVPLPAGGLLLIGALGGLALAARRRRA